MKDNPEYSGNGRITAVRILLYGRVQRVSFRRFAANCAAGLGICGYVRNLTDGRSLEVIAQGNQSSLDVFLSNLKKGPPGAQVEETSVEQIQPQQLYQDFKIV